MSTTAKDNTINRLLGRRPTDQTGETVYYRKTTEAAQVGQNALASGKNTVAVGPFSYSVEDNSVAVGAYCRSDGNGSTGVGSFLELLGRYNTGVGYRVLINGGLNNTVVGALSIVTGPASINNTIVGEGSRIESGRFNCTIVGQNTVLSGGSNSTGIGQHVTIIKNDGVGVGQGVDIHGSAATAVGVSTLTGLGGGQTAVGNGAIAGSLSDSLNTENTAVGFSTQATGTHSTSVGGLCVTSGLGSINVGYNNIVTHQSAVAIGSNITSTAVGQVILGSSTTSFTDLWFGRGTSHTGAAQTNIIHTTDGSGSNVAGDTLALYPGVATGNAATGDIDLYYAPAGSSGSTLQTPARAFHLAGGTGSVTLDVVGPHSIGAATNSSIQLFQSGSFSPASGNAIGYQMNTTLAAVAGNDEYGFLLRPTLKEASSGTHANLSALTLLFSVTPGSANTTDVTGIDIRTFAAASGTTNASGLKVDLPTGATNNFAINVVGGTVNIATGGSTSISTGTGTVKMSSANNANNAAWIPFQYAGTTYYVPAWTTNSP